jgi:EAL domain-containing protein (putative c-di-GMP-specific phosphodiesterase class I)
VESAAGYAILKRFGCDMAQGYFISRPMASSDLLAWMKESPWGAREGAATAP